MQHPTTDDETPNFHFHFAEETYHSRWSYFTQKRSEASSQKEIQKLTTLAEACALRLTPENKNEPLIAPSYTKAATDFTDSQIRLLRQALEHLQDQLLIARIADILWLLERNTKDALRAIDAYTNTKLESESWLNEESKDCWARAITLALQLPKNNEAAHRLKTIKTALLQAINTQLVEGDYAPAMISLLLRGFNAPELHTDLGERLLIRAKRYLSTSDEIRFLLAQRCLKVAKKCFSLNKDREREADAQYEIAESFAAEAESRLNGEHPSSIVAASFYSDAINSLLEIPKQVRLARNLDLRLQELRNIQRNTAQQSVSELSSGLSYEVDFTEDATQAEADISGKCLTEALLALAICWQPPSCLHRQELAKASIQASSILHLVGMKKLSFDGRRIAKRAPLSCASKATEAAEKKTLDQQMVLDHQNLVWYAIHSAIHPALNQLRLEHLVTSNDIFSIVAQSGVIPTDRIGLVSRGLKAGFEGDYVVALHLLTPQLEHLVRTRLQNLGHDTQNHDPKENMQMEAGLSTLAADSKINEAFGAELGFEIRALFADRLGPNLRNELAHGLLDEEQMQSTDSIYAWWLFFRIIYLAYWLR